MPVPRGTASARALRHSGRVFAFTLMGGFLVVAGVAYWRGSDTVRTVAQLLALVAFLAGVLVPGRLEPVRAGWMRFGEAIGRVTTPVLLAIVYYGVLTPTALVRRLTAGRDEALASGWHERPPSPAPARMERQF
ncbi:MAG: SxtJ family membrane protein [Gemmatimonadaceae bacterium]